MIKLLGEALNETLPLNTLAMVIIEDQLSAELFEAAASRAGYSVTISREGSEAIKLVDTLQPVLVVLDMELAHGFGLRILNHLRHAPMLQSTWTVMVTEDLALAEAVRDPDDFVLAKPVNFEQVSDLIRRLRRFKS